MFIPFSTMIEESGELSHCAPHCEQQQIAVFVEEQAEQELETRVRSGGRRTNLIRPVKFKFKNILSYSIVLPTRKGQELRLVMIGITIAQEAQLEG